MRNLEVVQFGETLEAKKTYYVQCGCKTFVFANTEELTTFLTEYIQNPDEYERIWYAKNEKLPQYGNPISTAGYGTVSEVSTLDNQSLINRLHRR
jgi:hypothetical protein